MPALQLMRQPHHALFAASLSDVPVSEYPELIGASVSRLPHPGLGGLLAPWLWPVLQEQPSRERQQCPFKATLRHGPQTFFFQEEPPTARVLPHLMA